MIRYLALFIATVLMAGPAHAQNANAVSLDSDVMVERTTTDANGRNQIALEEPRVVVPGDRLGPHDRQRQRNESFRQVEEDFHKVEALKGILENQIRGMDPDDQHYDAKVTVLDEYVTHHVKEEQDEMFPKCRKSGMDLKGLGVQIASRKREGCTATIYADIASSSAFVASAIEEAARHPQGEQK